MTAAKKPDRRAIRAAETRKRMRDAAAELFVAGGYGATSLQDVADKAGVAVQTVYFTFGNKRALLKELVDVTIAGDDAPVATLDRVWFRDAVDAPGAVESLRLHVEGTAKVLARVSSIMKMLDAAATSDPEIGELWPRTEDPRYTVQSAFARSFAAKPGAAEGLEWSEAADVLYGVLSPELYLLLVGDRSWSARKWERWALTTLRSQLCED
ncbi:helix-turn-helix domain-containing protein [Phytomonospora sp. NPDC050363]|uniref:TetR/AcrR family transcriptional regulator n=1 Tax=Phytomonospora sp. NPDC050363 TaxID=3155642 RepID=UPI0033D29B29